MITGGSFGRWCLALTVSVLLNLFLVFHLLLVNDIWSFPCGCSEKFWSGVNRKTLFSVSNFQRVRGPQFNFFTITQGPILSVWLFMLLVGLKSRVLSLQQSYLLGVITNRNHNQNYKIQSLKLGNLKMCKPLEELLIPWTFNACQPDRKVNVSMTLEGFKTILLLVYLAYLHLVYYATVHWYLPCPGLQPAGQYHLDRSSNLA